MDKEYKKVIHEVNSWLKKTDYKEIRKTARPDPYPWNMWSAKWSTYGAILCLKLGITPNQITYLWFYLGIIASFFLFPGNFILSIVFIALYIITYYFDYVDGDMARIIHKVVPNHKQNLVATWLDKVAYYVHRSLILLAIGVNLFLTNGNIIWLAFGFATCYLSILDNLIKLRLADSLIKKNKLDEAIEPEYASSSSFLKDYIIPFLRPEPVSILTFAILFNFLDYLLIFYVILFSLYFIKSFIIIHKKMASIYR